MSGMGEQWVRAVDLAEVQESACVSVQVDGHTLALFNYDDQIYAVDNRCPHMGFPLDRGTVRDGILTCYWHYARFDLASGGTFDQFADDVPVFPTQIRDGAVWVDLTSRGDRRAHQCDRLRVGLERDISLVLGKAAIVLLEGDVDPNGNEPFRIGLDFGTLYRQGGWGQGLTMHTCFMNMMPYLHPEDRSRAMYHGLSAVAVDSANHPPRFRVRPLPGGTTDLPTFKRWFRRFIEVRDEEGAERCIVSMIRAGADHRQMADTLFASVTDHRYIQIGHPADFTNKAFEALDIVGWDRERAEQVLTSLVRGYANATRQEESNAWRNPIDLVEILDRAFVALPAAIDTGREQKLTWTDRDALVKILLGDHPQTTVDAMLDALREGCTIEALAQTVTYAAALRIARFHTSNEFSDWDTALHTFTFANAIHMGLRRAPSIELLRGVFDAAMSVYLDRFLNVPAARLPEPNRRVASTDKSLNQLAMLLNRQQQVNPAGDLVAQYLYSDCNADQLLATLGSLLLREDRDFHTIQTIEAAFRQYTLLRGTPYATHVLVAAARYLAAHSPTMRAQGQTFQIAQRLHRGEKLFEEGLAAP